MKKKTSTQAKQPKQSKRATSLKDLKPRKDAKGGPRDSMNNLKQIGIG